MQSSIQSNHHYTYWKWPQYTVYRKMKNCFQINKENCIVGLESLQRGANITIARWLKTLRC